MSDVQESDTIQDLGLGAAHPRYRTPYGIYQQGARDRKAGLPCLVPGELIPYPELSQCWVRGWEDGPD